MHHEIPSTLPNDSLSQHHTGEAGHHFHYASMDHNRSLAEAEAPAHRSAQKTVDQHFGHARHLLCSEEPGQNVRENIVQIASNLQGKDLTVAPHGSGFGEIPKKYGCAASISNILLKNHQIGPRDFCADVDALEHMLVRKQNATHIDRANLRPGDIVIGRGPHGRHVGIVEAGANGQLMVLNNHHGTFSRDSLKDRFFDRYKNVYGLRMHGSRENLIET